jgi:hypothetical protein
LKRLHFFTMTGAVGIALWCSNLSVEYNEFGKTTE